MLAGQPELEQKLNQPQLRQLRQRITLRAAKTRQLTSRKREAIISGRLRIAARERRRIFSPKHRGHVTVTREAFPSVTNLLCEHALVSAFVDQANDRRRIDREVARDFDLHEIDPVAGAVVPHLPTNGNQAPVVETLRRKRSIRLWIG